MTQAPERFAINGNDAAGCTNPEVPILKNISVVLDIVYDLLISYSGKPSPNQTILGRIYAPQGHSNLTSSAEVNFVDIKTIYLSKTDGINKVIVNLHHKTVFGDKLVFWPLSNKMNLGISKDVNSLIDRINKGNEKTEQ